MQNKIKELLKESISVKEEILKSQVNTIVDIVEVIVKAIQNGKKLIIFGNGGSAADSQHIVAEFVGRFKRERSPIPAIALSTNTSTVTALSNDYGYEFSFKRQLEALASQGDIAIGLSTSGNAANVHEALMKAKDLDLKVITMTGKDGGKIAKLADVALKIPSHNTPRIQESHITAGHIICELVEDSLYT